MLTRQEAVSMIPPCVLQVEPHHLTLDMCASPGSKTTQMLEVIQSSVKNGQEPKGMVVANDCDTQRAYMLAHQCKRINSAALVITTHLGQFFPSLQPKGERKAGVFDRVLADVPCSGDGTIRKQVTFIHNNKSIFRICTYEPMVVCTLALSLSLFLLLSLFRIS
jgi:16S rRNA C967 or C1407 C5-methylase (RsmB/RsmF family)